MEEVDWFFCYRHFRPLKNQMRKFAMYSIDTKLSDIERRKLTYIAETLEVTAQRIQLIIPVFLFMPMIIIPTVTTRAKVLKVVGSAAAAFTYPYFTKEFQNFGFLIALPYAVNTLVADMRSGHKSSIEMVELLSSLHAEDRKAHSTAESKSS